MAAVQSAACNIVDLMPVYWRSIDTSDAAPRLRASLVDAYPDLYNDDYVKLPPGALWTARVTSEQAYARAHRAGIAAADRYLAAHARPFMRQFRATFADFKCDFKFYIAPSFGQMDGSAAFVNGENRIIFAPDVISRYHDLHDLKVLIDHETFHVYHHQVTGEFGAFSEAVPTILEALWSEGLATFASWRMNPGVSLDAALLQPGIPQAAKPHLDAIARDLLEHLDENDEATFLRYFVGGKQPPGYPPRAGYYVGTLLAERLSAQFTLQQLAHLNGTNLRTAVRSTLERLAHES
jgi:hypothetical protein